jgi:hypothetical protein
VGVDHRGVHVGVDDYKNTVLRQALARAFKEDNG